MVNVSITRNKMEESYGNSAVTEIPFTRHTACCFEEEKKITFQEYLKGYFNRVVGKAISLQKLHNLMKLAELSKSL